MPDFRIDGTIAGGAYGSWAGRIENESYVNSELDMELSGHYNPDSAAGYLIVTTIVEEDPGLNNYKLRVALVENNINWLAPNGTRNHSQTFRDMMPSTSGRGVTIVVGDTLVDTVAFTTRSPEVVANLQLIAFVQADQNRRIVQAAKIRVNDLIETDVDDNISRPVLFSLSQNYPNPFNAQTTIDFSTSGGATSLEIYDITGARVATLVNGNLSPGQHSIIWDGRNSQGRPVSSGAYFYRLRDASGSDIRRMTLLK